jgi:hypothetical protein
MKIRRHNRPGLPWASRDLGRYRKVFWVIRYGWALVQLNGPRLTSLDLFTPPDFIAESTWLLFADFEYNRSVRKACAQTRRPYSTITV